MYLLDVDKIENFSGHGYEISGYNFKGARFDEAVLFFNDIIEAKLEGADLSKLKYSYARVEGSIDKNTKLPESCTSNSDRIDCYNFR